MINIDELARRNRCKRRYARATVTILRSGGWAEFLFTPKLNSAVEKFERGEVTPDAVCWAFVRARVEAHSPTSSWKSARLERILPLVCECSTSPLLPNSEPQRVAEALVAHRKAMDQERRDTLAPVTSSVRAISELAVRQSRQMETIRKAMQPTIASGLLAQQARQMETIRKVLQPTLASGLLAQQARQMETIRTSLANLVGSYSQEIAKITLPSDLVADWQAQLRPVVAEAEEVIEHPTATNVLPVLEDLVERMEKLEVKNQERDGVVSPLQVDISDDAW